MLTGDLRTARRATREAVGALQAGDAGLNAGAEVAQLAIHPAALHHVLDGEAAFLVEGYVADAHRLALRQVVATGVAAVGGRLARRRAIEIDMTLEHGQEALGIGRIARLDDHIQDQAALAGGEIELVPVLHVTAPLDDDVGMRLEQADHLLGSRHRFAGENTPLALVDDALDQGQVLLDLGAPEVDLDAEGQLPGSPTQGGHGGLGRRDQLPVQLGLAGLAARVPDRQCPFLGQPWPAAGGCARGRPRRQAERWPAPADAPSRAPSPTAGCCRSARASAPWRPCCRAAPQGRTPPSPAWRCAEEPD